MISQFLEQMETIGAGIEFQLAIATSTKMILLFFFLFTT
jgi:hypothetical protein